MEPRDVVAEPAAVLALAEQVSPSLNGPASFRLAAALEAIDSGIDLDGLAEFEAVAKALRGVTGPRLSYWRAALAKLDAQLISVLDDAYPTNLRMVHDHPPFIFARGSLGPSDRTTPPPGRTDLEAAPPHGELYKV